MNFADKYLQKQTGTISINIDIVPDICVVIPCFNEPNIFKTLDSVNNASKNCKVLVIIVVNYSEKAEISVKEFNNKLYEILKHWIKEQNSENTEYTILFAPNLRRKHAGVGLARKIGMDAAVNIFNKSNKQNGIITSLDADTLIDTNYFNVCYSTFKQHPKTNLLIFNFNHLFEEQKTKIANAAILYEMYLRYFVIALRNSGFPYSFHTIGSCFAVNVNTYVKQGGMNKKQAGEDFYFLHKIFPLGNCFETYQTKVFPSARISNRVPFGTGPSLNKIIENNDFLVYDINSIFDLKTFFSNIELLFNNSELSDLDLADALKLFLSKINFKNKIEEAKNNSSNLSSFKKRILQHFDAFQIIKYLNFAHENGFYKKQSVRKMATKLLKLSTNNNINDSLLLKKLHEHEEVNCRLPR